MSERKPWQPSLDTPEDANPFANRTQGEGKFTKRLRDPEEDTSPLQGSKDISDEDSLVDVIADESAPPSKKPPNT
ncbi:MAG TPA: hypothetical protein VIH50_07500 [Steroidobacteraceae bacterium]|jgi:hypothetical protein